MQSKSFWESKTFWFNLLTLLVTVALPVLNHFGWAEFEPGAEWVAITGVLVTVVNLILRLWFTRQAIKLG
jgi:protein-S-isoprenylcysteine O-methyltransferase Ste14